MIPAVSGVEFVVQELPSKTYRLMDNNIRGYRDGLEAVKQAIYIALNVERYKHVIYSWNYGIELVDLFGKPLYYVQTELGRRIKEALEQDGRIKDVYNFRYSTNKETLVCTFNVDTIYGTVEASKEVML